MITLLSVEFRRVFARRLVKALVILALIGVAVSGVIAAATSHRPTAADLARADQLAATDLRECYAGDLIPERFIPEGKTLEAYCREIVIPDIYIAAKALRLRDLPKQLQGVSFILIVGGLVIGASFRRSRVACGNDDHAPHVRAAPAARLGGQGPQLRRRRVHTRLRARDRARGRPSAGLQDAGDHVWPSAGVLANARRRGRSGVRGERARLGPRVGARRGRPQRRGGARGLRSATSRWPRD